MGDLGMIGKPNCFGMFCIPRRSGKLPTASAAAAAAARAQSNRRFHTRGCVLPHRGYTSITLVGEACLQQSTMTSLLEPRILLALGIKPRGICPRSLATNLPTLFRFRLLGKSPTRAFASFALYPWASTKQPTDSLFPLFLNVPFGQVTTPAAFDVGSERASSNLTTQANFVEQPTLLPIPFTFII